MDSMQDKTQFSEKDAATDREIGFKFAMTFRTPFAKPRI
jgi:hypothetical protein